MAQLRRILNVGFGYDLELRHARNLDVGAVVRARLVARLKPTEMRTDIHDLCEATCELGACGCDSLGAHLLLLLMK